MFPSPRRVSEPRTAQREQANRRRQAVARHLALRGRQESHHLELHLAHAILTREQVTFVQQAVGPQEVRLEEDLACTGSLVRPFF